MSKERENAIKILSHLSPSIREAVAVLLDNSYAKTNSRVVSIGARDAFNDLAKEIRSL